MGWARGLKKLGINVSWVLPVCVPQVYRISFPATSGPAKSSAEGVQLGGAGSLMGLEPETFYQLFPFRECVALGEFLQFVLWRIQRPS